VLEGSDIVNLIYLCAFKEYRCLGDAPAGKPMSGDLPSRVLGFAERPKVTEQRGKPSVLHTE